ncbi:MAG: quinate 5-dehydrogenase [Anaerolineae bacterium]|nr:quinate 5-dehydrogenase [Anaerolineae bacterium]
MKRAVSVSIGSSKRDKQVEVTILGEQVCLERIGTDGDMQAAARLFAELDGQVDALGVGGALLGLMVDERWYVMRSVRALTAHVNRTPVVDGTALKMTLERKAAAAVDAVLQDQLPTRTAFSMSGVDRYGLTRGFLDAGYESVIGDLMFTLGIGYPIHSDKDLKRLAATLIPIVSHLPFSWLYPTGEAQEKRTPKWTKYFNWASVIAGDCHYIARYMPDDMTGKVIVTNTTTPEDRRLFKPTGIRHLFTTTPIYEGRSFGTNLLEAAIVAVLGWKQPVDYAKPGDYFRRIDQVVNQLGLAPQYQEL